MLPSILVIGKPNSGKSLLFNRLTGLRQKVANFPGVTVEVKHGRHPDFLFIDLPGVYTLDPLTKDEAIAIQKFDQELAKEGLKVVLCLLDATRLEVSLVLALQALQRARAMGKPCVFAVNMMDEIIANKTMIDIEGLSHAVGVPVIGISAKTCLGLEALIQLLRKTIAETPSLMPHFEPMSNDEVCAQARVLQCRFGPNTDILLKSQNRLDHIFLSGALGGLIFLVIMALLFQSIFTWALPIMDFIERVVSTAGQWVTANLSAGILADFINDVIFGGFGAFLVFVPQIFILTVIIGILEDSGYLARAAIICHKPLGLFGLSGRSFIPLLTGHACAIPAIMAARTIESPRRRLLTMLVVPLTVCSARLPVYSVLIAALIPPMTFFGVFGLQGLCFLALYLFGIICALAVAGLLSRYQAHTTDDAPFILELPPYRLPHWRPLLTKGINYAWSFISKAGLIIFAVNAIVWFLGYFPKGTHHLEESYLGSLGRIIGPIFAPIGLDWKYGVAILASFVAREVFVGTLGTLFGIEEATDRIAGLAEQVQSSGLTLAAGIALLVFYALAMQCASTLAIIGKETDKLRIPLLMFFAYSVLAYSGAYITYTIFNAFG